MAPEALQLVVFGSLTSIIPRPLPRGLIVTFQLASDPAVARSTSVVRPRFTFQGTLHRRRTAGDVLAEVEPEREGPGAVLAGHLPPAGGQQRVHVVADGAAAPVVHDLGATVLLGDPHYDRFPVVLDAVVDDGDLDLLAALPLLKDQESNGAGVVSGFGGGTCAVLRSVADSHG